MNDNALHELMRREAGQAPLGDGDDLRRGRRRLRRHRAIVGAGSTGLAAVTLVAGSAILPSPIGHSDLQPAPSSGPAVAVSQSADGTVTGAVQRPSDLEKLESGIKALGIPIEIDVAPPDKECEQPRFRHATGVHGAVSFSLGDPDAVEDVGHEVPTAVYVHPDRLEPHQTVVLQAGFLTLQPVDGGGRSKWAAIAVADGPVQPCVLVDDVDNAPPGAAYHNTKASRQLPGHDSTSATITGARSR
jgi:hypothetical protein